MHSDPRYLALVRRARELDGTLYFGVTTTHVFCRPACPCRTPLPEHVEYFKAPQEALRSGYRPCKRCKPLGMLEGTLAESRLNTPLGEMIAIGTSYGLALLEFADRPMLATQRERVRQLFGSEITAGGFDCQDQLAMELAEYFVGARHTFTVPTLPLGTPFQRLVWRHLADIPAGETLSYEALADRCGRPGACRAVGRANGDNRLAIVIPCHRVVGRNGALTGYGGGLWRKQALLELEGARDSARALTGSVA